MIPRLSVFGYRAHWPSRGLKLVLVLLGWNWKKLEEQGRRAPVHKSVLYYRFLQSEQSMGWEKNEERTEAMFDLPANLFCSFHWQWKN
jgi:hypothetical protein